MNTLRHLRLDLLSLFHSRGEILVHAMAKHGEQKVTLLALQCGISMDEIRDSIRLYSEWEQFTEAERWNHDRGGETPATCQAAFELIKRWRLRRNHDHSAA